MVEFAAIAFVIIMWRVLWMVRPLTVTVKKERIN
jgi:predicted secreted protein